MRSKCHGTTWDFYDSGDEEALIGTGTRSSQDECSTGFQTVILGLQIVLDQWTTEFNRSKDLDDT